MMMTINFVNTNLNAVRSLQNLRVNTARTTRAAQSIASGQRVNTSGDDPSGWAIAERIGYDITTQDRSRQNIQDGLSVLEVVEGSLSVIGDNLQRIRELGVQMASDVNGLTERTNIGKEMRALLDDIARISDASQFNGLQLLDGTLLDARVQINGGSDLALNTLDITNAFADSDPTALGLVGVVAPPRWTPATLNDIYDGTTTQLNSSDRVLSYMGDIDEALKRLNSQRAQVGAFTNSLNNSYDYLGINVQGLQTSKSRIVDTDVAKASAEYTQAQVLQNAAVSILQQANSTNQTVLQLLQR
jgi:flagellin